MSVICATIFAMIFLHGIVSEIIRQSISVKLDGLLIMRLNFSIIYGLCPLVIFYFPGIYAKHIDIFGLNADAITMQKMAFAVLISYVSALFFYRMGERTRSRNDGMVTEPASSHIATLRSLYFLTFGLGLFSLFIYTNQYGGYWRSVELAGLVRQGLQDEFLETEGSLLFFKKLTTFAFLSSVIATALLISTRDRRYLLALVAAIILSAMVTMILGSRGQIVISVLMLVFSWMAMRYPHGGGIRASGIIFFIILLLVADYFIGVGKLIFAALYRDDMTIGDVISNYDYVPLASIVGYYDEYVASSVAALSYERLSFTYFYDSLIAPVYIIPTRVFGFEKPETIVLFNTYLVTGIWKNMTPPGLVGYGYYSLGFTGIIISSAIYSYVLGWFDRMRKIFTLEKSIFPAIYMPFVLYWGIYFFQGDPQNLTLSITPTAVMIGFAWFLTKSRQRPSVRAIN